MTVAFCVWLLENYFRRVLVECCNFFSAKGGCGMYCVWRITSVDFVCFVRGVF